MRNFSILTVMLALTACARSDYDNFKKDFMEGCAKSGGTDYVCECTFDKVEKEYGREKLEHFQRTQNPPMSMVEFSARAGVECRQ